MAIKNISKPSDFYKQTNNVRSPYESCFNTSMINFAEVNGINFPRKPITIVNEGKKIVYSQPEDIYDYFIETDPELVKWYMGIPSIAKAIKSGEYSPREFWDVEVKAFNKWVGYDACYIKYKLTKEDVIKSIDNGRALVISGRFCGFGHVVCIVGYEKSSTTNKLESIIFDDPYGNPIKNYKPVGVGGNDVKMTADVFWKITEKSDGSHYAIVSKDWEKNNVF